MSSRMTRLAVIGGLSVSCLFFACGGPGGGPTVVSFTIAGRTFRFEFGQAGVVDTQANVRTQPRAAGFTLFDAEPATTPPSGTISIRSADVTVGRLLTGKQTIRSQPLPNGTATVTLSIASGQSANNCANATLLAEFDLVITSGAIAVVDEVYDLTQEALSAIATNDVTICIEVLADFDGQIIFNEFSLSFGGGQEGTVVFSLQNADSRENIHILLPGETFADENRLAPGTTVSTSLSGVSIGDSISMRAGRNGTVLDTTACPSVAGENYTAEVVWDGSFLTCTAEQANTDGEIPVTPGTQVGVPINALGNREDPTDTINGIDYAVVGVLDVNSSDVSPASLASNVTQTLGRVNVDLAELGLEYVEEIRFATHGAWVADLPAGVTIATLTAEYAEDDAPTMLDMTLGDTTAEWSHERAEHDPFRSQMHNQIPTLYSFVTGIDSASEYIGRVYAGDLALDTSRTLTTLRLELVDPNSYISERLTPLTDTSDWAGQALTAVTLIGPATGGGGGGGGDDFGTITGTVVDAQTNAALANVAVSVTGTGLSTTTDASGAFTIADVPAGGQSVVARLDGYVETSQGIIVLDGAVTETSIGMLQIGAGGDHVAAVLSWGQDPRDLDLHMSGPDGSGGRFHAYFGSRTPVSHVDLDLDDTTSFGPETMTVRPTESGNYVPGDYHVWVHHFSGETTLGQSSAAITLFAAGSQVAQYSVGSATGDSSQLIWLVVNFTVTEGGAITNLNVQQTFADGSSGTVFPTEG